MSAVLRGALEEGRLGVDDGGRVLHGIVVRLGLHLRGGREAGELAEAVVAVGGAHIGPGAVVVDHRHLIAALDGGEHGGTRGCGAVDGEEVHRDRSGRAAFKLGIGLQAREQAVAVDAAIERDHRPGAVLVEHGQLRAVAHGAKIFAARGGRAVDVELIDDDRSGRALPRGDGGRRRRGGRGGAALVGDDGRQVHVALGTARGAHIGPGGAVGQHREHVAARHTTQRRGAGGGRLIDGGLAHDDAGARTHFAGCVGHHALEGHEARADVGPIVAVRGDGDRGAGAERGDGLRAAARLRVDAGLRDGHGGHVDFLKAAQIDGGRLRGAALQPLQGVEVAEAVLALGGDVGPGVRAHQHRHLLAGGEHALILRRRGGAFVDIGVGDGHGGHRFGDHALGVLKALGGRGRGRGRDDLPGKALNAGEEHVTGDIVLGAHTGHGAVAGDDGHFLAGGQRGQARVRGGSGLVDGNLSLGDGGDGFDRHRVARQQIAQGREAAFALASDVCPIVIFICNAHARALGQCADGGSACVRAGIDRERIRHRGGGHVDARKALQRILPRLLS